MTKRNISPRFTHLLTVCVMAMFVIVPVCINAQRPGGAYADVTSWTISFWIVVRTKEKCCDIQSEETTEGSPDWMIHYSIYHEFKGAYRVGGPIPGYGMPKLNVPADADTRRNPALAAQIALQNLSTYVGWEQPGPGVAKDLKSPIYMKIKDDYDLSAKSKECTTSTLSVLKESRFDDTVPSKYGHASLGFDLLTEHYTLDLSMFPVNPGDEMKVVNVKTTTHRTSNDPSEPPDQTKTEEVKRRLLEFENFSSASVEHPDLKFRGPLPDGTEQISICRTEPLKAFNVDNPLVAKDIEENKTVTITVEFVIRKGMQPTTLDSSCK